MQENPSGRSAAQAHISHASPLLNERVHFEALNALSRENQRMRSEMHMLQTYVFNYGRNQQQSSLFINQLQQNLHEIKQTQSKQEELSTTLAYERDQAMARVTSMAQTIEDMGVNLRREQDKVMKLSLLVTKLNYMKPEDLRCVLDTEVDVADMLEKYMAEEQKSDKEEEGEEHQTVFMVECYRQLVSKYKEYNAQLRDTNSNLLQAVEEKDAAYSTLQTAFAELQSELYSSQMEDEGVAETAEIGMVAQASAC